MLADALLIVSFEALFEAGGAGSGILRTSGLEGGDDAGADEAVDVGVDIARYALVGFRKSPENKHYGFHIIVRCSSI